MTDEIETKTTEHQQEEKEASPEMAAGGNADDDEAAKKAKKKEEEKRKKKAKEAAKKEKEKKEKEKTKKKPNVTIIKETLKKNQEEKERIRKEYEAEQQRLDELERLREEKDSKEKERKEKEKQKKKDRIARQKREGTYMTAEQKQKQRRQLEALEQLKQSGQVVQGAEERRPSQKEMRKKKQKSDEKDDSPDKDETKEEIKLQEEEEEDMEKEEENDQLLDDWEKIESEEDESDELDSVQNGQTENDEKQEGSDNESVNEQILEDEKENEQPRQNETKEQTRERILLRFKKRHEDAETKRSTSNLRAPVICVLGHVDTGKTKMLDRIRRTHVQDGEAGGITQQIGATQVPDYAIKDQGKMCKDFKADRLRIPGFLIIDTPGHESFRNLRSRGSSLCDIAILIVDIMHGLEPQTLESIQLLKKRNTPFVIALNKIDRLYQWKSNPNKDIQELIKSQQQNVQFEFQERVDEVKTQFAEQAINVALYWENPDITDYISMVPTSAFMGDGVGNIMVYIAQYCQEYLDEKLAFSEELNCSVLEVKALPGLGTTVDVILVNGTLRYGDTVIVAGSEGSIVTQIRELLMPQALKELRVKNPYEHYKEVKGAQGIKILAKDFDKALAGLPLFVAQKEDEVQLLKEDIEKLLKKTLQSIRLSSVGVYVQASTLGSLEALLEFLRTQKIPYCGINIGPVHKKDVMKCSTMLEHDSQWAVILAFDVKIEREAQQIADDLGVKIFSADIIYHLQDAFIQFREELRKKKRREHEHLAIFPCKLRCLPQHIFKTRDPIVIGVNVEAGILKVGTPLCVPDKECLFIGNVSSIEANKKPLDAAKVGQEVCIKIENTTGEAPKMYDRHFDYQNLLVSRLSRETIDVCKEYFREDLTKADWLLVVELKKLLGIL